MFDTKDILVFENGNGGEISVNGNDIELNEQLLQQPYLCLFGGNFEAITSGNEQLGDIRNDWWGNSLFFNQDIAKQFNSITEKTLREVPLNSVGRIKILRAAERDLESLKAFADISVDVIISKLNEVVISIKLTQPNQVENTINIFWDGAKQQVIKYIVI